MLRAHREGERREPSRLLNARTLAVAAPEWRVGAGAPGQRGARLEDAQVVQHGHLRPKVSRLQPQLSQAAATCTCIHVCMCTGTRR